MHISKRMKLMVHLIGVHKRQAMEMVASLPSYTNYSNAIRHLNVALDGTTELLEKYIDEIKDEPSFATDSVVQGYLINGNEFSVEWPYKSTTKPIPLYKIADGSSAWKPVAIQRMVDVPRFGWLGVWDAIKAAITGDSRLHYSELQHDTAWVRVHSPAHQITGAGSKEGVNDMMVKDKE